MLKHMVLASTFLMLSSSSALAQSTDGAYLYETEFQEIERGGWDLWGCFDKPCNVDPGQMNLFGFSRKNVITAGFHFVGRTGEKTFDVVKSTTEYSGNTSPTGRDRETYHLYFSANEHFVLMNAGPFKPQGCTKRDNILLRMFDFKNNRLRFQIILPDCLKTKT